MSNIYILYKVKILSLRDYNKVNRKGVTMLQVINYIYRFEHRKTDHENNFSDI